PLDPEPSAESGERPVKRSPEKTIGITPSQILEISPGRLSQPPPASAPREATPRRRMQDLSMWLGNVLSSSEFMPQAGRQRRRVPWRLLVALLVLGAAGGLVWRSWPKVPFSNSAWPGLAKTSPTPPAAPPPSAPAPPTTTPVVPPSTFSAGVEEAPT